MSTQQIIQPARKFRGNPVIPGDKSISHRGLIFGALAKGRTEVIDILDSADVLSTASCLKQLGANIMRSGNKTFIDGIDEEKIITPSAPLDCGNSGTTIRLLTGVIAGRSIQATLTGDASLVRRPMKRVADPLWHMGAQIQLTNEDYAPITISGRPLKSINYELKVASAQIKTAIILAALSAQGVTRLTGAIHSRDHTERMLKDFGIDLHVAPDFIEIQGKQNLTSSRVQVPGDPSTAAFWMAAASMIPNADLRLRKISLNPTRLGFLDALKKMGAQIKTEITSNQAEMVGDIQVNPGDLRGVYIQKEDIPSLIDEIPLIAILATQAQGVTEVEGAEELRVKESDRIESVALNLRAMGAEIEVRKDGFRIEGPQKLHGTEIQSFHDHRIAMAFSVAGLIAQGTTVIQNAECAAVSYPRFFDTLKELTQ